MKFSIGMFAATLMLGAASSALAECGPLSDVQDEIKASGGGKLYPITREELLFARGLFAAAPPVSPYPPGETGWIAMFEGGSSAIVFADGDKACGKMGVSPSMTKLLLEIDKSI